MSAVDLLFSFLLTQFKSTESSRDIFSQYDKVRKLPQDHREQLLILLYFTLEALLIKSKPPITTREFTIKSLRKEIAVQVKLEGLSDYYRLIFLPDSQQAIVLFILDLQNILNNSGVKELPPSVTKETFLEGLGLSPEVLNLNNIAAKMKIIALPEVISNFRALYFNISQALSDRLGESAANSLFKRSYDMVKSTYSFDIVGLYVDVLPRQIFESERLSVLSREELERNVVERTRELATAKENLEENVSRIEMQNKELEETKLAVLNVLEDEKLLEGQLKIERDRAQAILESMGEGLYVVGKDGKVVMLNPAAETILGITADLALKKFWYEIIEVFHDQEKLPLDEWPVHRTLTSKNPVRIGIDDNYFYKTLSGDKFPVSITTSPLLAGSEILGAVIIFKDITRDKEEKNIIEATVEQRTRELRAKTQALQEANRQVNEGWLQLQKEKAKLTASINSLSLGFIMTDMSDQIIILNPAALKILDYKDPVTSLTAIEEKLGAKVNLHEKHEICHRDKKPIHIPKISLGKKFLSIFMAPILPLTPSENDIGTVILIEDITEAQVLERSKDEFFSIASHELRTPLTAIRGNTSLIKQFYMTDVKNKDLAEMIDDIHGSAVRLIDIVNDFLDTSRLETGKIEFKKEKFAISEVIEEVIKEYKMAEEQQHLFVKYQIPTTPLPIVLADRNRTKQIFINLIGNSIKFTEKGGITVAPEVLEKFLKIYISDTGRGIAPVNQNLLFRKFQQAGESLFTRDTTRGTGLGLYISKLMAEGMGGAIRLEKSEEGKGSTFSVMLPRADTAATESKDNVAAKMVSVDTGLQVAQPTGAT